MIFSGKMRTAHSEGVVDRPRFEGLPRRAAGKFVCLLIFLWVFFILLQSMPSVFAQSPRVQEYQVKAAFLFNFANFVEWPDKAFTSKESSFVVGILGANPFGDALNSLHGKTVKGRKMEVRNYTEADEALNCQILFISGSERGNLPRIMKSLKGSPVLIVGDRDGFCREGGMINLVPVNNRIGFEINDSAARRAGLKISSQLLKLAREIVE